MRRWNQFMSVVALAATVCFGTACRDKKPDGPPLSGLQENFKKSMRNLEGTLPAPPDEIARAANTVFKRMGLVNVATHTSPTWTAVVDGQKPGGMRSPYSLKVRKGEDQGYNSYVEISVGLTGDEGESRFIVSEVCKELNLSGSAPPQNAPDGSTPNGPPPGK